MASFSESNPQIYQKYINSPEWSKKRQERLAIDNNRCRTCWHTESLEVHHVTYDRFGNEDLDDMITLCKDCHKAVTSVIRHRRYQKPGFIPKLTAHKSITNYRKETTHGTANSEIPTKIDHSSITSQWADSKSLESVLKANKANICKKGKD